LITAFFSQRLSVSAYFSFCLRNCAAYHNRDKNHQQYWY
jgi:hypothetical protein